MKCYVCGYEKRSPYHDEKVDGRVDPDRSKADFIKFDQRVSTGAPEFSGKIVFHLYACPACNTVIIDK